MLHIAKTPSLRLAGGHKRISNSQAVFSLCQWTVRKDNIFEWLEVLFEFQKS